jgi:hypothetical protein
MMVGQSAGLYLTCNSPLHLVAIILDAGVQWYEAYNAVRGHNRAVVGGYAGTVGTSGGWIMGGGHSALSPTHGLGMYTFLMSK